MKRNLLALLGLIVCLLTQKAESAVGYVNTQFYPGFNFFSNPLNGETRIYDSAGSGGWIDGDSNPVSAPTLAVAGAAFFGLGTSGGVQPPMPTPVPEPGSGVLLLIGAVMCKVVARRYAGTKP